MKQYLDILDRILKEGVKKEDRTGTGTLSIFGTQPILAERRIPAADNKETAPEVDNLRTAVVSQRRHQREIPARARREDMERVG